MLTLDEIERLETFDGGGAAVLSVNLDLDPARRGAAAYPDRLRQPGLGVLLRYRLAESRIPAAG